MFLVYKGQRHVARLAAVGVSATSMIVIIGCSSASHSSSAAASPSPRQALLAAATRAQQVTSADETVSVRETGIQNASVAATLQLQLKPALEARENVTETTAGKATRVALIFTRTAMYLSEPSMVAQVGKPWVKMEISQLKGTPLGGFAQLWRDIQNNDFADQTQLQTAARNTRAVGRQTVGGVPTTEYVGSFTAAEALKALPARFRTDMAPQLKAMGNTTVHFRTWIDDQHQTRKTAYVETINGETVSTTMNITAINPRVTIALPPAGQTATAPKS